MLFDQVEEQYPEGFPFLLFCQRSGNVARHRIRPSRTDFTVDSGQLILGQSDRNFRLCHTTIIRPLRRRDLVPGPSALHL